MYDEVGRDMNGHSEFNSPKPTLRLFILWLHQLYCTYTIQHWDKVFSKTISDIVIKFLLIGQHYLKINCFWKQFLLIKNNIVIKYLNNKIKNFTFVYITYWQKISLVKSKKNDIKWSYWLPLQNYSQGKFQN